MEILAGMPVSVGCVDVIYAPEETVFLAQARWSGHRTLNGKGMNIFQAAEAFHLLSGRDPEKVVRIMAEAW